MLSEHAKPEDFQKWRDHAKTLSIYELRFTIKDCREAEKAMKGHNSIKEGYYADQAFTYSDELRERLEK